MKYADFATEIWVSVVSMMIVGIELVKKKMLNEEWQIGVANVLSQIINVKGIVAG